MGGGDAGVAQYTVPGQTARRSDTESIRPRVHQAAWVADARHRRNSEATSANTAALSASATKVKIISDTALLVDEPLGDHPQNRFHTSEGEESHTAENREHPVNTTDHRRHPIGLPGLPGGHRSARSEIRRTGLVLSMNRPSPEPDEAARTRNGQPAEGDAIMDTVAAPAAPRNQGDRQVVTSKTRRRRELAAARITRQTERRAAERRRRQRLIAVIAAGVVVVLTGTVTGVLLFAGNDDKATVSASASATPSASAVPSGSPSSAASAAPASTKVGPCTYTSDGRNPSRPVSLPTAAGTVDQSPATMVITTNKGTIKAALDAAKAPCTVHALLTMANAKYFDGTPCHRETAENIFVLQCGDPTGTGQGGPGFAYANENTNGATYTHGVIAMANAGANTNGSQFFLIYKDPNAAGVQALGSNYTIVGKITDGLSILDTLTSPGIEGGSTDGAPVSKAQITSVTLTQTA